jgi:putative transposase
VYGKGSYNDNLFIERLWCTVKYEEVYLRAYQDGRETKAALADRFRFYNNERPHQALGYRTPAAVYNSDASDSDTVNRTAGLHLAPVLS